MPKEDNHELTEVLSKIPSMWPANKWVRLFRWLRSKKVSQGEPQALYVWRHIQIGWKDIPEEALSLFKPVIEWQGSNIKHELSGYDAVTVEGKLRSLLRCPEKAEEMVIEWTRNDFIVEIGEGPIRYYRFIDHDQGLVEHIDEQRLETTLKRHISDKAKSWARLYFGVELVVDNRLCTDLYQHFKKCCIETERVESCLPSWKQGITLHRCSVEPQDIPTPLFDAFGSRQSDWDFILAWYWGVYSGEYLGRQSPYSFSNGETGRSTTFTVINEVLFGMGKGFAAVDIKKHSVDSKFIYSVCFKKKLLYIGECKSETWIFKDVFHAITGGDPVSVEFKGKTPFTSSAKAAVITLANSPPKLTNQRAVLSRVVPIECADFTDGELVGNASELLKAELPGFLWKAREAWHRLNRQDGYSIETNETTKQIVQDLVTNEDANWELFFRKYLELKPNGRIGGGHLRTVFQEHFRSSSSVRNYADFEAYLQSRSGVWSNRSNGTKWHGIQFNQLTLSLFGVENEKDIRPRRRPPMERLLSEELSHED